MHIGDHVTVVPGKVAASIVAHWRVAESRGLIGVIVKPEHDLDHRDHSVRLRHPGCEPCLKDKCTYAGQLYAFNKDQLELVARSLGVNDPAVA
jgi:hypothetical protein